MLEDDFYIMKKSSFFFILLGINCIIYVLINSEEKMKLREFSRKIKLKIKAVYLAYKHKDTPIVAKIFAGITVGYALSPIDLIPDFIPILGYLDDLIILPLLIYLSIKLIPKDIMKECEEKSEYLWKSGKPKNWRYGIPIIIVWSIVIGLIVYKWCIK